MNRQKLILLTLLAVGIMSTFQISLGLAWLQITMRPENADGPIELGVITGTELIPAVAALTPVMWLGIVVALLLKRRIWVGFGLLTALGLGALLAVIGYNLSGNTDAVSDQLLSWQNVAAAHDVTHIEQVRTPGEWFALAAASLLVIGFGFLSFYAFKNRTPAITTRESVRGQSDPLAGDGEPEEAQDPIALWEQQRRDH